MSARPDVGAGVVDEHEDRLLNTHDATTCRHLIELDTPCVWCDEDVQRITELESPPDPIPATLKNFFGLVTNIE